VFTFCEKEKFTAVLPSKHKLPHKYQKFKDYLQENRFIQKNMKTACKVNFLIFSIIFLTMNYKQPQVTKPPF